MAKYLYWRGNSLWCTFPLPGKPQKYPLGIKRRKPTRQETDRCIQLGELKLSEFRVKSVTGELTAQRKKEYNPKYWRLVGRYWYYSLRFKKSAKDDRSHLKHSLKRFGACYAKEVTRENIEVWRQEMKQAGSAVNAINNRYAYLKRAYNYSNEESKPELRINHDPTIGMKKMKGGNIRSFLLTPEKFERNYEYIRNGEKWAAKPNKHCGVWKCPPDPRFAFFYLLCWETGRRPEEVSQYTWEMLNTVKIEGREINFFSVPPELAKTDTFDNVIISDRLWHEMHQLGYRKGLVARNSTGSRWKHWDRHKRKLETKYGQDAGWIRDTRRGFVTRKIVQEGFDEGIVMKQSGHRTRETIKRYRINQLKDQATLFVLPDTNNLSNAN